MAIYGAGPYSAVVTWNNDKTDTHKFGTEESRDRFMREEARKPNIKKVVKN